MVTAEDALQAALKDARVHYPENKNHKPPPTPKPSPGPAGGNADGSDQETTSLGMGSV
jgi:hypothetical protein